MMSLPTNMSKKCDDIFILFDTVTNWTNGQTRQTELVKHRAVVHCMLTRDKN